MASWSRCGRTTKLRQLERSHQPTAPVRSSGCMPACASSMSLRRTSLIESSRLSNSWRAAIALRRSPTRTGSCSGDTLRSLRRVIGDRGAAEQLLHGEPHPGNVLTTKNGLLFIDLETCCMGEVEFDRPTQHVSRSMNSSPFFVVSTLPGCGSPCSSCSAAPRSPITRLRLRNVSPEQLPVRVGERRSAIAARHELLSLLDSISEVRRRDIELAHAGMQPLERTGAV